MNPIAPNSYEERKTAEIGTQTQRQRSPITLEDARCPITWEQDPKAVVLSPCGHIFSERAITSMPQPIDRCSLCNRIVFHYRTKNEQKQAIKSQKALLEWQQNNYDKLCQIEKINRQCLRESPNERESLNAQKTAERNARIENALQAGDLPNLFDPPVVAPVNPLDLRLGRVYAQLHDLLGPIVDDGNVIEIGIRRMNVNGENFRNINFHMRPAVNPPIEVIVQRVMEQVGDLLGPIVDAGHRVEIDVRRAILENGRIARQVNHHIRPVNEPEIELIGGLSQHKILLGLAALLCYALLVQNYGEPYQQIKELANLGYSFFVL